MNVDPSLHSEVVSHVQTKREAEFRKLLLPSEVDRMLTGPQRRHHDPVAIRDGGLWFARDARIKHCETWVRGERKQTRGGAVVEQVLQRDSVDLHRQFGGVIDK